MSKVMAAIAKRKLQHRGEGKPQNREWRKRATLTFLTAWVQWVSRHPQAHCFAGTQGTLHLAIVMAKIYYSDATRYTSSKGGTVQVESGIIQARLPHPPSRKVPLPAALQYISAKKSLGADLRSTAIPDLPGKQVFTVNPCLCHLGSLAQQAPFNPQAGPRH